MSFLIVEFSALIAPKVGVEPTSYALTVRRLAIRPPGNKRPEAIKSSFDIGQCHAGYVQEINLGMNVAVTHCTHGT